MTTILLISDLPELEIAMMKATDKSETIVERIVKYELKDYFYDLIVIDFTKQMLNDGEYKIIFNIKYRNQVPVLAILEDGSTRNKLNILSFGVDDYLERKETEKELSSKIEQLLRQDRVMKKIAIKKI